MGRSSVLCYTCYRYFNDQRTVCPHCGDWNERMASTSTTTTTITTTSRPNSRDVVIDEIVREVVHGEPTDRYEEYYKPTYVSTSSSGRTSDERILPKYAYYPSAETVAECVPSSGRSKYFIDAYKRTSYWEKPTVRWTGK